MPFIVYMIKNDKTGHGYVGYTGKTVEDRMKDLCFSLFETNNGSPFPLRVALAVYGRNCFSHKHLAIYNTAKKASSSIDDWIVKMGTQYPFGYNISGAYRRSLEDYLYGGKLSIETTHLIARLKEHGKLKELSSMKKFKGPDADQVLYRNNPNKKYLQFLNKGGFKDD